MGNQLQYGSVTFLNHNQVYTLIIPVQLIRCQTVSLVDTFNHASVLFVSPCIDF